MSTYNDRLFDVHAITVKPSLADRFVVPPFSVLDARQGYWQDRKRDWLATGIRSEVGRGDNLLHYSATTSLAIGNTSIFDPVLCEIVYRWFSPHGGAVLDPFAGGSVRGIVAAALERIYVGCDLSEPQISANRENAAEIGTTPHPTWIHGDSRNIRGLAPGRYDLIFTCPPYGDLEVYSDDPADISTLDYPEFLLAYRLILAESATLLAPDRFACIVVSEIRHKVRGHCHGLVPDTIRAMQDAGLRLYNEAVLVTSIGSLPIRAARSFPPGRKMGRSHQNVLIFCKGDGRAAADACGAISSDYDVAEYEQPAVA